MVNILVTGGNGFLGSWLCNRLSNKEKVFALYNEEINGSILDKESVTVIKGDVKDFEFVKKSIEENNIDLCVHLAAQTIVAKANNDPLPTLATNIIGTYNILEASRLLGKKVILASSDKAYGNQEILPYKEGTPLQGNHPYDVSKSCADLIAQAYYNTYKTPIVVTRLANIFGGGDMNINRVVPDTCIALAKGEKPVIRSDGSPIRQYIYVEDAVNGYIKIIEKMLKGNEIDGMVFNLGSSEPMSVYKFVKMMMDLANMKEEPEIQRGDMKGEIHSQYLSSDLAHEILGWEPKFDLGMSLKKTIDWYKEYNSKVETNG
jgi:CDP-glucose 4,6-dehydratase